MDNEYLPFIIERPGRDGRIRLRAEAKYWAEQHGMSNVELARYLLLRDEQGPESPPEEEEFDVAEV
jgi:hypothetical protein